MRPTATSSSCPAHADTHPSLRVGYNAPGKKIALKCRAGCKVADVVKALGLTMADLFNVEPGDSIEVRSAGGVPEKPSVGDRAALKFYLDRAAKALLTPEGAEALAYAARRFGITAERAEEIGLGYDDTTLAARSPRALRGQVPRRPAPRRALQ